MGDSWEGGWQVPNGRSLRPKMSKSVGFSQPPPHQLRDLGSAVSSPVGSAKGRPSNNFAVFWVLKVASPVTFPM